MHQFIFSAAATASALVRPARRLLSDGCVITGLVRTINRSEALELLAREPRAAR